MLGTAVGSMVVTLLPSNKKCEFPVAAFAPLMTGICPVDPEMVAPPPGAPPSLMSTPDDPSKTAKCPSVADPGPTTHVSHAIVPADVIMPPVMGEVVEIDVTVPVPEVLY